VSTIGWHRSIQFQPQLKMPAPQFSVALFDGVASYPRHRLQSMARIVSRSRSRYLPRLLPREAIQIIANGTFFFGAE
jgi:hypothetical protein